MLISILWIVAVLCILVVFLLCIPVQVKLQFTKHSGDDEGSLEVKYLFGLIRWKKRITEIESRMTPKGPAVETSHQTEQSPILAVASKPKETKLRNSTRVGVEDVWEIMKHIPEWIAIYKQIRPVLRRLTRRIEILVLRCEVTVGTGDVVTAGMATGSLWALVGGTLGKVSYACRCKCMPDVQVRCDFDTTRFDVSFDCIMRVRAGYAISAGLRLVRVWRRRETNGAPNTRFNANSHDEHTRNG